MKLLIIEDNVELVDSLRVFLDPDADITHVPNGREGLLLAEQLPFEAVVLDLGLPDMPGLDVCRALRQSNQQLPILVLSGSRDPTTKIALFEAGADDFVTKPFTVAELQARLFALLRRSNKTTLPVNRGNLQILQVGDLTLDPASRRVKRNGQNIPLRRKEFDILEYLMRNQDKVVTRAMIMDNVWEFNSLSWDGTINVHIKRLRDQVDRPYTQKLIKTAYGLGYTINDKDVAEDIK